jgi:hypothetical protein
MSKLAALLTSIQNLKDKTSKVETAAQEAGIQASTYNLNNVMPGQRKTVSDAIAFANGRLPDGQKFKPQEVVDMSPKPTGTMAEQYVQALKEQGWILDLNNPECIVPRNMKTNKAVHITALTAGFRDWLASQKNFPSAELFKKYRADLTSSITAGLPHVPVLF